ncbi:hypothetical protein SAMN02799625_02580 [Methylobacterium sp. UNC300MFChir4.1]|uniref:hypothetical protein n=1 Tax=Methylobacterium sp. UNC300MFChir4.1 TaxID=1502747 RepID=UPI0008B47958|nr:hypothetical protein [Methylobacterium sp. UNC300MFChir4.1]SEO15325.1 hypothetical protein SAMN02799625_02580 [Methylobacterium sp. UNC300MFChir4.1]
MRVGIVTTLVLLGSFEAAVAQGVQDDPRRRRLVLPSIREATDCIARETLNEPGIEGATRPGQLRAALAQPMRRCADEVDAMIAAHDQVYYPGYGEAFFQGPYLQDLVRAIQKRIGPELARRALEAAERAAAAQQSNPGFQVAQPAPKPFDQSAEQAKRETEEREKREVDAMWQRARQANAAPAPTPATAPTMSTPAAHSTQQSTSTDQSGGGGSALGGFVALVIGVFVLREAAKRRARKRRYERLMAKYGDASIVDRIMAYEMWQGMTAEMLTDSWGSPVGRDREVYKTRTTETWKYGQTGKNRFKHRVLVENSIVVGFKQR